MESRATPHKDRQAEYVHTTTQQAGKQILGYLDQNKIEGEIDPLYLQKVTISCRNIRRTLCVGQ